MKDGVGDPEDLRGARTGAKRTSCMAQELCLLGTEEKRADREQLAFFEREARAAENLAVGEAEHEFGEGGIEPFEPFDDAIPVRPVDAFEEPLPAHAQFRKGTSRVDMSVLAPSDEAREALVGVHGPRESREECALEAKLSQRVGGDPRCSRLLEAEFEARPVLATEREKEYDQDSSPRIETLSLQQFLTEASRLALLRRWLVHDTSIGLAVCLCLFLLSCGSGKEPSGSKGHGASSPNSAVLKGYSFGTDPIEAKGLGQISREGFRSFVAHRLAGPWLRFLALERALAERLPSEIRKSGIPRELQKAARLQAEDARFDRWYPKGSDEYRSEKARIDFSKLLATLWLLHGEGAAFPKDAARLEVLLEKEVELQKPEHAPPFTKPLARCGSQGAEAMDVYPDLLALIRPVEREQLLEAAIRERSK